MNDNVSPDTPAPRQRRPKISGLDSLADIKREVAHLYRAGRRCDLPAADASKLGSLLGLLARLTEDGALEERLATIEKRLAALVPRRCA